MKSLKVSEDLHKHLKSYCSESDKSLQNIVESKLEELFNYRFKIDSIAQNTKRESLGSKPNISFDINLSEESTMSLINILKSVITGKTLEDVDQVSDIVGVIKTLEQHIESSKNDSNALDVMISEMAKQTVNEHIASNPLNKKKYDTTVSDAEIDEFLRGVQGSEENLTSKDLSTLTTNLIKESITKNRMMADVEQASKDAIKADEEKTRQLLVSDINRTLEVRGLSYDVILDNSPWTIKEYNETNKFVILKKVPLGLDDSQIERTVEALSILDKLNYDSVFCDEHIEKIVSMYNVCSLNKRLNVIPMKVIDGDLNVLSEVPKEKNNCSIIYSVSGHAGDVGLITKHKDYYIYNKVNSFDIISIDKKNEVDFVLDGYFERYQKEVGAK